MSSMIRWIIVALLLAPAAARAQVTYEANGSGSAGTTTSASFSITLGGASSTRAVVVGLAFRQNSVSSISVTVGGASAGLISGTDTGSTYTVRTMLYGLATSLTGAQTVAVSWTTNSTMTCGAISATGVNQTTPFNNGTKTGDTSTSPITLSVTSNSGDLTTTVVGFTPYNTTVASNQNEEWHTSNNSGSSVAGAGDVGGGAGTTSHSWTNASFTQTAVSVANFVQAATAPPPGMPAVF